LAGDLVGVVGTKVSKRVSPAVITGGRWRILLANLV
jgi:hypothetical protein